LGEEGKGKKKQKKVSLVQGFQKPFKLSPVDNIYAGSHKKRGGTEKGRTLRERE